VRLGIVLLVLGIAYGISMLVLIRVRERAEGDTISEHVTEKLAERGVDPRPVTPRSNRALRGESVRCDRVSGTPSEGESIRHGESAIPAR
jgi:hypothetical protein